MSVNLPPKMPAIKDWLHSAAEQLELAGSPSARLDSELILAHFMGVDRTYLHAHADDNLAKSIKVKADVALSDRKNRLPIAYSTGHKEFYGRNFLVTPDTLIPRPESEAMIELLKDIYMESYAEKTANVIDIGTGSGVIGISAKLEIPNLMITLSDNSPKALEIATQNADRLKAQVSVCHSDLLSDVTGKFDVILANLPYVDRTWERSPETNWEPASALFADDGGLQLIQKLVLDAPSHLEPGGYLILESDPRQHKAICKFAQENYFTAVNELGFAQSFRLALH